MQLKRIVTEFPRIDPTSYAFTYADTAPFEEEVDEWFSYNEAEYKRLHRARDTFERRWRKFSGKSWLDVDQTGRKDFVEQEVKGLLHGTDLRKRCKSLQTILHVVLGVWDQTAGMKTGEEKEPLKRKTKATPVHLEHMKTGVLLVGQANAIPLLFEVMRTAFKRLWYDLDTGGIPAYPARDDDFREKFVDEDIPFIQDELDNVITIMYLTIEGVRNHPIYLASTRTSLCEYPYELATLLY